MNTPSTKALRQQATSYSDDALGVAGQALELTREFANDAMERANDRVRELRTSTRDLAGRGMDSVSGATAAAQRQLGEYARATTRYVADEPVKAALIAAAVGAIVAGLIIALRRNRSDR